MDNDGLIARLAADLRSAQWSNDRHREALRQQLCQAASRPARRSTIGRHRVLIAVCVVAAFSAAGVAAHRWRAVFFLRGMIADEPTTIELPVDDDGNARLIFTDDTGAEHEIIIRPEDVGENGVIRGMEWHLQGPPKGSGHEEPQRPPEHQETEIP